jgi:hypothetical protein
MARTELSDPILDTETLVRGDHTLIQRRPPYKSWRRLRYEGELDEIILQPGRFLSDKDIRDNYLHKYYPHQRR